MNTSIATQNPETPAAENAGMNDNQRRLETLCRFIIHAQDGFAFAPVEFDLPSLQNEILVKLRESFHYLNVVTVKLSPPPSDAPRALTVLDQLEGLVKLHSPGRDPEALIITGYETLFADAIADDGQPTESLRRAIQPLNLGRNIFAEKFQCPVLLCLPPAAMAVFLRSAPDLVSWQSHYFKFESDIEARRAELQQAVRSGIGWLTRWLLQRRKPEALQAEAKRIETLIADAEALQAAPTLIARLYQQLGWIDVVLKDRTRARWAFAQMLRLAREADKHRLIGAAEKGHRAADNVRPQSRVSPQQSAAIQEVFRGAAALTEAEGLYGREDELRELTSRVIFVGTRFLTVWGETGCGKTSLVLAGLLPELKRQGHYLPIVVHQWDEPEVAIRHALAQTSGLAMESFPTLLECVRHVAQQTEKTLVIICDQFEQFFTTHPQRSERAPLLKSIGACFNDPRVPCKFIFIVRGDQLGRMVEFESDVPEPLEQRKRFYLPLFNVVDAARVMRQQADKAGFDWPEVFVQTVVNDLTKDGRVSPIELQLVGAALAVSGIGNELDYARAGRARALMVDYLQLTLDNLGQSKRSVQTMKRILLALVAEPAARLSLTPDEIARRTGISSNDVCQILNRLTIAHLVHRVEESPSDAQATNEASERYELTHDMLLELVLMLTRDLQDRRRQADRILTRALEDLTVNPLHTIGLRDWSLVRKHGDDRALANPKIKAILQRSILWGVSKTTLLFVLIIFTTVTSLIWLSIDSPVERGKLLLNVGFTGTSLELFLGALKSEPWQLRQEAVYALKDMAVSDLKMADQILQPLLAALNDKDAGDDAATALGQIARSHPTLAWQMLRPLLVAYNNSEGSMRVAVASALGEVAGVEPKAVNQALQLLNDYNAAVRNGILSPLTESLIDQANRERLYGRDPVQFLFDQLEEPKSFTNDDGVHIPYDDNYRDVVAGAMAQWIVSDRPKKAEIYDRLELMRRKFGWRSKYARKVFDEMDKLHGRQPSG